MRQQSFHPGNALTRAANVAPLAAKRSPLRSQTIISLKDDSSAAKEFWIRGRDARAALQNGPAN